MKKLPILLAILILSACSAKLLTPTQTDVEKAEPKYPGITLVQLTEGKQLYENHCGNCHTYKDITKGSDEKWKQTVPRMVTMVNKKAGKPVLDETKQNLILKYVLAMRVATKK